MSYNFGDLQDALDYLSGGQSTVNVLRQRIVELERRMAIIEQHHLETYSQTSMVELPAGVGALIDHLHRDPDDTDTDPGDHTRGES